MSDLKKFNSTITGVKTQSYLQQVLGDKKSSFVNNLTALVANNKMLQECEPVTIMYAALKATALDLPLDQNLGFAYVLPYKNNRAGISEAQFQIGYKGIVQLCTRSNEFERINVTDVRQGELKSRNRMTGDLVFEWVESDEERNKLPIVGYLGYFRLKSGYEKSSYWSVEELKKHGSTYSQTFKKGYGVWKDNFDAMAKKTVLKLMLNKGDAPMSVEIQQAIKYDQSVILDEQGTAKYIDNQQSNAEDEAEAFVSEAEWDDVPQSPVESVEEPKQG